MQLQRGCLLTALVALLLTGTLSAGTFTITGQVLSDNGMPLTGAEISIGEAHTKSTDSGGFSISVPASDLYSIRFAAEGHFPMLHSFSAFGLSRSGDGQSAGIPDVTLVERKDGRVLFAFGGDTMAGRRYSKPYSGEPQLIRPGHEKQDTAAILQFIAPYLQLADYTSVNLEIQVMKEAPDTHAPKSVVFFTPPETLDALVGAGIDHVTLGNNHIYDYLDEGLDATLTALDASPLAWSGAGRTEKESLLAHRAPLGDDSYSFLGYLGWAGNFWPNQVAEGEEKGGAAYGSTENVRSTVKREATAGHLPVVHYHGSREYTDEPTLVTETRLKTAIDEGAVIAIGHHPHMAQGFEIYRDKLIAYSMGNFMFDQYMEATQRSYLLYVWMDGEVFHRAEIMPLHIKGYVPMPATDTVRQAVLRRAAALSSRRGVYLTPSGGHAVITPGNQVEPEGQTLTMPVTAGSGAVWPVDVPWHTRLTSVSADGTPVLLGTNKLPTGHFESFFLNGAPDRSWIQEDGVAVIVDDRAPSGDKAMQLSIPAGQQKGRFGMRAFDLTFVPGTPTSFVFNAWANEPARVIAYQQWRKRGESRLNALKTAELRPIGERELTPGAWQEMRFDFDSERVSAYSYRVVVEVMPVHSERDFEGRFDDLDLVEWLTPPLAAGQIPGHLETSRASHAGLAASKH